MLTPSGEQLLAGARPLFAQASALLRRVDAAGTFVVGFMPGLIITPAVRLPVPVDGLGIAPLSRAWPCSLRRIGWRAGRACGDRTWPASGSCTTTTRRGSGPSRRSRGHVAPHGGVTILPLSTAVFYSRQDLVPVPVEDMAPNEVAPAWAAHRHTPLIDDFIAPARQV